MALPGIRPQLTQMQRAFISYYPISDSATDAARKAGYKHPMQMSTQLLALPDVRDAINEAIELRDKRAAITPDRILLALWESYEDAREHGDRGPAIRALELIGKHLGMFPRPDIQIDNRTQILQLPDGLSLAELRQLARGDVAQLPGGDSPDLPSIEQSEEESYAK